MYVVFSFQHPIIRPPIFTESSYCRLFVGHHHKLKQLYKILLKSRGGKLCHPTSWITLQDHNIVTVLHIHCKRLASMGNLMSHQHSLLWLEHWTRLGAWCGSGDFFLRPVYGSVVVFINLGECIDKPCTLTNHADEMVVKGSKNLPASTKDYCQKRDDENREKNSTILCRFVVDIW